MTMNQNIVIPYSIIVPARNEEITIADVLRSVRTMTDDLIVVDGHSTDRTAAIAREHGARVIHDNNGMFSVREILVQDALNSPAQRRSPDTGNNRRAEGHRHMRRMATFSTSILYYTLSVMQHSTTENSVASGFINSYKIIFSQMGWTPPLRQFPKAALAVE